MNNQEEKPVKLLRHKKLKKTFFVAVSAGETYGTAVQILEEAIAALKKGQENYYA